VRNYIREGKSNLINNVIQTGSALGMHTMSQDIARLVRAGKISREEASKYVEGEESSALLSER
ncbi:MAG: hypothetical protein HUJ86_07265, partial [Synergistes sp.]|nr:hypothetical protein [Synergistes sp.]